MAEKYLFCQSQTNQNAWFLNKFYLKLTNLDFAKFLRFYSVFEILLTLGFHTITYQMSIAPFTEIPHILDILARRQPLKSMVGLIVFLYFLDYS